MYLLGFYVQCLRSTKAKNKLDNMRSPIHFYLIHFIYIIRSGDAYTVRALILKLEYNESI